MEPNPVPQADLASITTKQIVRAAQLAVEDAIHLHARNNVPLVILRKGTIVEVDARRRLASRKAAKTRAANRARAATHTQHP